MNFSLPVGIMHDGVLLKDFTLSKPKGGLRAELQDAPNHAAGFDLAALRHVVRSLGPVTNPNDQILRRLSIPDRDFIHACCTAGRYEGCLPVNVECDCGTKVEDSVVLNQVELKPGKGEVKFVNGLAAYDVEFLNPESNARILAVIAIPTIGADLRYSERRAELLQQKKPTGDADLERLANSILSWQENGGESRRISARDLRDMDLDLFDAMTKAMKEIDPPGLDDEAVVICPDCSREHTVPVQFDWWLLPFAPRTGSRS